MARVYLCDLMNAAIPAGVSAFFRSLMKYFQFMALLLVPPEQGQRKNALVEVRARGGVGVIVGVAVERENQFPAIAVLQLVGDREAILRARESAAQQHV